MSLEIFSFWESLSTLVAGNWLFSSVSPWMRICFTNAETENVLGHQLQWNDFSPVCVLKCSFKLLNTEKFLRHWLQGNDFSPKYVFKCVFKYLSFEKVLGYWLQGFRWLIYICLIPVWLYMIDWYLLDPSKIINDWLIFVWSL